MDLPQTSPASPEIDPKALQQIMMLMQLMQQGAQQRQEDDPYEKYAKYLDAMQKQQRRVQVNQQPLSTPDGSLQWRVEGTFGAGMRSAPAGRAPPRAARARSVSSDDE